MTGVIGVTGDPEADPEASVMGSEHLPRPPHLRGTLKWTVSDPQSERLVRPPGANVSEVKTATVIHREQGGTHESNPAGHCALGKPPPLCEPCRLIAHISVRHSGGNEDIYTAPLPCRDP